ncbi:unnamed protein product, partial [Arabidopsis halleri]
MVRGRGRPRGCGRARGRGRVPAVAESVARSVTVERVAHSHADQVGAEGVASLSSGEAGVPAGVAGVPVVDAGVAAGVAQARDDRIADLLTLLLERLPARVPAQVPVDPLVPPGVVEVKVQPRVASTVAEELPSYLKIMEQMQRIGTGFFSGGASPEDADAWLRRVERNFLSCRYPAGYQVDIAVHYLEGDAHLWWRGVAARRVQAEMAWADFGGPLGERLRASLLGCSGFCWVCAPSCGTVAWCVLISQWTSWLRLQRCWRRVYGTRCRRLRRVFRVFGHLVLRVLSREQSSSRWVLAEAGGRCRGRSVRERALRGAVVLRGAVSVVQGASGVGAWITEWQVVLRGTVEAGHVRTQCPQLRQGGVPVVQPVRQAATAAPRAFTIIEPGEPSSRPITGTLFVGGVECHVLFDTGASHCFVSPELAARAKMCSKTDASLGFVEVAGGKLLTIHGRASGVDVQIEGESMPVDLIICSVELYDVILGMDWLGKFRAHLDYHRGRVKFDRSSGKLVFQGVRPTSGSLEISVMQAERMIERGCEAYLAVVSVTKTVGEVRMQDVRVVRDFPDVF